MGQAGLAGAGQSAGLTRIDAARQPQMISRQVVPAQSGLVRSPSAQFVGMGSPQRQPMVVMSGGQASVLGRSMSAPPRAYFR